VKISLHNHSLIEAVHSGALVTLTVSYWQWISQTWRTFARSLLTLVFIQYKTTELLTYCWNQQSLSRCITHQRCLRMFNSRKRQNAYNRNFKWTHEDLSPCYCDAIKTNSAEQSAREPPNPILPGKEQTQAHQCITPEQWTLVVHCVSVIPANKLSLQ